MQITLVAATLLLLGVASAKQTELPKGRTLSSSVLAFTENNFYVMKCKQRQDITIDVIPPFQYAVVEHQTNCKVKEKTIGAFDRSDDEWKFATMVWVKLKLNLNHYNYMTSKRSGFFQVSNR